MSTSQSAPVDPVRPAGAIQLARLGGVPVYLAGSWFLGALLLLGIFATQGAGAFATPVQAVVFGATAVVLLFLSVFVHEGAHALVARATGSRVLNITLTFWGGVTRSVTFRPRPLASALVALAGPVANFVLAGVGAAFMAGVEPGGWGAIVANLFFWINATLGIYNILPGLPLDGGQVTAAVAWAVTKNHTTGLYVGAWAGRIIVVLVGCYALYTGFASGSGTLNLIWALFIVMMLWQMTSATFRVVKQRRALDRLTCGQLSRPAILLPDSMPQQLALAYARPGTAFVLRNDNCLTGCVPSPGQRSTGALEPLRQLAIPVGPQPQLCGPEQPITDFAIAMQAEARPAIVLRFPSGEPRVLTLDDIVERAARMAAV